MGLNVSNYNNSTPFVRFANPGALKCDGIIVQNIARATPLQPYTILAKITASGKYVPLSNISGNDGSNIPAGVYFGEPINASDLVAGDYTNVQILTGAAFVDKNQIVLENGLQLSTIVPALNISIEDFLNFRGIFMEDTIDISSQENV